MQGVFDVIHGLDVLYAESAVGCVRVAAPNWRYGLDQALEPGTPRGVIVAAIVVWDVGLPGRHASPSHNAANSSASTGVFCVTVGRSVHRPAREVACLALVLFGRTGAESQCDLHGFGPEQVCVGDVLPVSCLRFRIRLHELRKFHPRE